jgi:methylenetetrahydrofolate dehydrogenase (NADP+)/methenyltetrahydrofolate cyclohydrolase
VRAILAIVDEIAMDKTEFVVLGAHGAVGRPLVHFLKQRGAQVAEVEWDTPLPSGRLPDGQVVISCVGKAGLVIGEMVRDGVIVIDVGMSEVEGRVVGDMTDEVCQKASVAVPVPGGVGPVTIACLMQNVVDLTEL